jgi:hypothetical protein
MIRVVKEWDRPIEAFRIERDEKRFRPIEAFKT